MTSSQFRQFSTPQGKLKAIDLIVDKASSWVILFHGFGADAYDLKSLSEVLVPPTNSNWLFPQGPLEVPIGPGWTGRAWWNIDVDALNRRQVSGENVDLSGEKPEALPKLRQIILESIAQLGVPWNQIILGGFSQGAMLATDLFLHAPEAPKGLLLFSGALINKDVWKAKVPARAGSKYFICHGSKDMVLPHKSAQQLESMLNAGGMKGGLMSFPGGHEIPPQAILKANEYMKGLSS